MRCEHGNGLGRILDYIFPCGCDMHKRVPCPLEHCPDLGIHEQTGFCHQYATVGHPVARNPRGDQEAHSSHVIGETVPLKSARRLHTNPANTRKYPPGKTHAPATSLAHSSSCQHHTKCTLRCSPRPTMSKTCPQRTMCSCRPTRSLPSSTCPDGRPDTAKMHV